MEPLQRQLYKICIKVVLREKFIKEFQLLEQKERQDGRASILSKLRREDPGFSCDQLL